MLIYQLCSRRNLSPSRLLPLPAGQLGGELAEQVACGPGPGMGEWAGIVGWRGGGRGSMRGRTTVPDLPSMESAPYRGSPGEAGGGC